MCIRDRAIDRAIAGRRPLIIVAASGGARMMEGVASLMQMAKISSALAQLDDAGVPYICAVSYTHLDVYKRQGLATVTVGPQRAKT